MDNYGATVELSSRKNLKPVQKSSLWFQKDRQLSRRLAPSFPVEHRFHVYHYMQLPVISKLRAKPQGSKLYVEQAEIYIEKISEQQTYVSASRNCKQF